MFCVMRDFQSTVCMHRASVRYSQFVSSSFLSLLQIFNYDMCIFFLIFGFECGSFNSIMKSSDVSGLFL